MKLLLNLVRVSLFCQTVGKATEEKGYKKADVIVDKQVTQALGGGNCQVSSTLYNAILKVSDFKVTERHPHGKKLIMFLKEKMLQFLMVVKI